MPTKRPALICSDGHQARTLRHQLAMKQDEFWGRIAVTQSAASRYESETNPLPIRVAYLLHIAYGPPARAQQLVAWLRQANAD
ncbi:MAG: transcriptional regulator [Betaproteobacteria bacterium HGW-Betaproteobacteria-12]|nr:MAG: transcriptional regulator [Betaproteobacteria bacterium HGW-Betaproteobacteria-12]